jgi:hypothetical protein
MKTVNDTRPLIISQDDIEDGQYQEPPKTEADIALEDFLDKAKAIGSAAKLTINKLSNGLNSSEIFCASYPVDKYSYFELLEILQKTWGAGDYRIYCTVKGRKGVLQNQLVSVAGSPQQLLPQAPTNQNDVMASMMRMMQENNERLLEALKPKEDAGDRMKFMQEMLMMKQIFGGDQKPQASMLSGVKEMVEVMSLMQGLSGGGATESEPVWMKALTAFAPVAAAAVNTMAQPKPQPPMMRHPHPQTHHPQRPPEMRTVNPEPTPVNEPIKKEEASTMPSQAENVKMLCDALDGPMASMVAADKIAETIVDKTPDESLDALEAWVVSETLINDLIALDARVVKHHDWFCDLIEHVKAQLGLESRYAEMYDDDTTEANDVATDETPAT